MRTGFAGLVGRPNVGKSTLVNRMLGTKVSITSDKPQTTRLRVRGVLNRPSAQVVLVDTRPVLYVERGGRGLVRLGEDDETALDQALTALADAVHAGRVPRLSVERVDGEPVIGSPLGPALLQHGFRSGPRKLTLSA